MLANIEFYTYNSEVWYRLEDGECRRLDESDSAVISEMIEQIQNFYPEAYAALSREYEKCKANQAYYRYRIVSRFCKCNFGLIDETPDVTKDGKFHFEFVPCPLRGECRCEKVVCSPVFNHRISAAEMRVLQLLYNGAQRDEIADKLYLSVHTVNNHIRNAFVRIGVHSMAEFVKWASSVNIFGNGKV